MRGDQGQEARDISETGTSAGTPSRHFELVRFMVSLGLRAVGAAWGSGRRFIVPLTSPQPPGCRSLLPLASGPVSAVHPASLVRPVLALNFTVIGSDTSQMHVRPPSQDEPKKHRGGGGCPTRKDAELAETGGRAGQSTSPVQDRGRREAGRSGSGRVLVSGSLGGDGGDMGTGPTWPLG